MPYSDKRKAIVGSVGRLDQQRKTTKSAAHHAATHGLSDAELLALLQPDEHAPPQNHTLQIAIILRCQPTGGTPPISDFIRPHHERQAVLDQNRYVEQFCSSEDGVRRAIDFAVKFGLTIIADDGKEVGAAIPAEVISD